MRLVPRSELRRLHERLGIPADYVVRRKMLWQTPPRRLVSIGRAADDGQPVRLAPGAARAWRRMQAAAQRDGVTLLPLSGFRSVHRQVRLFRRKRAAGESVSQILRLVAAPGCSEHHSGRALDIGSPDHLQLDRHFAQTPAFAWLRRHAGSFGFVLSYPRRNIHRIGFEPWHWCWKPHQRGLSTA